MTDRVQAAVAALCGALAALDGNASLRRAAVAVGHDGHLRHAERVAAACAACTEASPAPAAAIGAGPCSIRHPVHAPRAALFGLLCTFKDLPATVEIGAIVAELRQRLGELDGMAAGRA